MRSLLQQDALNEEGELGKGLSSIMGHVEAGPLVTIGPVDPFKGIPLWILTYMDPQDPILQSAPLLLQCAPGSK